MRALCNLPPAATQSDFQSARRMCMMARLLRLLACCAALVCGSVQAQRIPGGARALQQTSRHDVCQQPYAQVPMSYKPSSGKVLALTFDDGPEAVGMPALLDVLQKHGVPATFFLNTYSESSWLGPFLAPQNQAVVKRALAEGHEIGSHAAAHLHLPQLMPEVAREQIDWAIGNITAVTGGPSVPLFRAPYGEGFASLLGGNPLVLAARHPVLEQLWDVVHQRHVHVGWSFSGSDFKVALGADGKADGCVERLFDAYGPPLVQQRASGAVLMHSTMNAMGACPAALDKLITYWRENGHSFVSVPALVQEIYGASPAEVVAKARACPPRRASHNPMAWVRRVSSGSSDAPAAQHNATKAEP